jgi:putative pyruvate formate lyase activating enzyme
VRLTTSELREREQAARAQYARCRLCARSCEIDRTRGERGPCQVDDAVHLGGWGLHFGEEPELTGRGGSGLVLMAACNLACAGCETSSFSREGQGVRRASVAELAGVILELQRRGAENVQFVTPTHQLPVIVSALRRAAEHGFERPVVWNCGGYESLEALALLDGIVDVYLPDLKHGDDREGRLAGVLDYWTVAQACVAEMHRQVGDLARGPDGVARRGVLARHLVLPDGAAGTERVMRFLASLSPGLRVNVMAQFQPVYQLAGHPRLGRRVTPAEVRDALRIAAEAGLRNVWSAHR